MDRTYTISGVVDVPVGEWYRDSDGKLSRRTQAESIVAEVTLVAGGLEALAERAAKSKHGRAAVGPLRARITERRRV